MKRLFYFSGSLLFLTLTLLVGIQIGVKNVEAQAPEPIATSWGFGSLTILLSNGDTYARDYNTSSGSEAYVGAPRYVGNFFDAPVAVEQETWGGVKKRFADKPEDK